MADPQTSSEVIRIVLADDHAVVRSGLRLLLESQEGFEVVAEAGEAGDALRYVRAHRPAVLVLDLNMPDGDGISLLPRLRAIFGDRVHVAALTGYGQQRDRDITRDAGFQEHLTKPVDIDRLEATLASAAAARR